MSPDMFAMMLGGEEAERPSPPIPEALIATLRETLDRYLKVCPFKVGDLVTPCAGFSLVGAGEPFIVTDTSERNMMNAIPRFDGNPASHAYGARIDMRVAHWLEGHIIMHWVESWQFEKYTGEGV